ncbi:class I SAM-dependent methyltransferase [Marinobacterium jannaschii]|uniref:class I SAM-dependent methyltransferase n=1 Tax=Marinobacterium jannaschii TaxID=64970 RepID=UPI000AC49AB9|nr:class I SAM-dependent methyltransferase [Marinobacterium jannaschii]
MKNTTMADQETIDVYNDQVESYVEVIDPEAVDPLLLKFIARLAPEAYVLDLGCGPALSSVTMRDHGLRVDPTDASEEMVKWANEKFDIGARQALFQDIDCSNTYDAVWANFCLLHAPEEVFPDILRALNRALKPHGVMHLAMKLGSGATRDKIGRFYSYYSQQALCSYLQDAGFMVADIQLGEAMSLAGEVEPWIALTVFSEKAA